jgi:hypothetical protein
MEALIMLLSAAMPVDAMADLLDEHDTRLWRVLIYSRARAPFTITFVPGKMRASWPNCNGRFMSRRASSRGRLPCPSVVILNSQSVKTTERGGTRGFDGYKRVKGLAENIYELEPEGRALVTQLRKEAERGWYPAPTVSPPRPAGPKKAK